MASYFEGTEKKLELALRPGQPSLREWPRSVWSDLVAAVDARILSSIDNDHGTAYLLSESSLFVYDDRLVMITCGQTRLTRAVPFLMQRLPLEALDLFAYERKNEVFPHAQPSGFLDDVEALAAHVPGRAFQFGWEDEHHLFVYQMDRPCRHAGDDVTVELLMYGLSPPARQAFAGGRRGDGLQAIGLRSVLDDFLCDEHHFEPSGYSLNAIRDDRYLTVHVTPEVHASYASVETNADFAGGLDEVLRRCVDAFGPRSFDLVVWERGAGRVSVPDFGRPIRSEVTGELPCGYRVRFLDHGHIESSPRAAIELGPPTLESETPR